MPETHLYFIAIVPGSNLRGQVRALKRDIAARFQSTRALKVVPHITLKAPFQWPAISHDLLIKWFQNVKLSGPGFTVALNGFGAFNNKNHPVIFIKPAANLSLVLLQQELIYSFRGIAPHLIQPVDTKFTPHMTIAYRDLTTENFEKAWNEYSRKEFNEQFAVHAVHLLQHNGAQWNIITSNTLAHL